MERVCVSHVAAAGIVYTQCRVPEGDYSKIHFRMRRDPSRRGTAAVMSSDTAAAPLYAGVASKKAIGKRSLLWDSRYFELYRDRIDYRDKKGGAVRNSFPLSAASRHVPVARGPAARALGDMHSRMRVLAAVCRSFGSARPPPPCTRARGVEWP